MSTRIRDLLERNAQLYGDQSAVINQGDVITWAQLTHRCYRLCNALGGLGLRKGSRIAAVQGNSTTLIELAYAAAMAGAVLVPISPRYTADEVGYVLQDAEIAAVFVEPALVGRLGAYGGPVILAPGPQYDDLVAGGLPAPPPEVEHEDDTVLQLYTSGTTGRPKGALLSQRALIVNGYTTYLSQRLSHDDVFLSATPLTHAAGATRIFTLALDGITHVILPRYDIDDFLDAISRHGVTTTILVPTMLRMLLDHPALDHADLSSLRNIIYGAAPAPRALIEEALRRLDVGLIHAYGLTEGCPALTALSEAEHRAAVASDGPSERLRSVGRPVAGVQIRVVDEQGRVLPPGSPGELWVRSGKNMSGYWHRPEETDRALRDGWLATGDVGYLDDSGYVYLVDRKKDLIISGGMNVYPSEIERVLLAHPGVRDAAVIGREDERWGEVPVAFVVVANGVTAEALLARCNTELARYKVPQQLELVADLPRNETGKVLKHELRDRLTG